MATDKEKRKLKDRLKDKYRLTIHNDSSLEEKFTMRLSPMNLFAYVGGLVIAIGVLVFLLLAYSPLKIFLPSYADSRMRESLIENTLKLDSIEQQLKVNEQYISNIRNIMEGRDPNDHLTPRDTVKSLAEPSFEITAADSLLRLQFQSADKNYNTIEQKKTEKDISGLHFYSPVSKGIISSKFDYHAEHFGIDIKATPNEGVKAVLDGTVVNSTWTLATGYIIEIQHENNLVSFYKHNSALLKKVGDRVKAGEVVAIIGNSGELTTGPHLHFEIWHNGVPLNPEDYIVF